MNNIKKGDIVARKSYNKDIIFVVKKVINRKENKIALLKGLIERVEADSDIKDLELVDKNQVKKCMDRLNDKLKRKAIINKDYKIAILTQDRQNKEKIKTGKILHLDGEINGVVKSESVVIVGKSGSFKGELNAEKVVVNGLFEGDLNADSLEILAGGLVNGNISVNQIAIENGGKFIGNSSFKDGVGSVNLIENNN